MALTAIIATICGTFITTVWFIRNIRKQNSKVLKVQLLVSAKIEEGQEEGHNNMAQNRGW